MLCFMRQRLAYRDRLLFLYEIENKIICQDVGDEKHHYAYGVEDGASAKQVVKDVVGGAVARHKEHIVVIK